MTYLQIGVFSQVRLRHIETFPQFGGSTCTGDAIQKQSCFPKKSCPLQTGCGNRFRCTSGKSRLTVVLNLNEQQFTVFMVGLFIGQCINPSLVCNGDHDCEDGLDEQRCSGTIVCDEQKPPPNSDLTGRG